ncbi:hypothetical protein LZI70_17195 [Vibrio pelagius]|uniref:Uncharacterized protein n=1 Tax=Vibrio pelagius TaxID=28169 RepID=A0ABY5G7F8_VIBPE|nr:hypothetical protein [Vibrio pelagius]UTT86103.1 hypothetical protein LZI70_17195 [Vibrio pelagius]
MSKNNTLIVFVALFGILLGWLATIFTSFKLEGHYLANPVNVIMPPNDIIYNASSINIEFKQNNSYDLLYVTNREVGFTSSGTYSITSKHISLDEEQHQRIVPERELDFYEKVMISEGSVLSSDFMPYIPISKDEILLITPNSMLHLCKSVACRDLPHYKNEVPKLAETED